ncbi:MAG: hypothetical protein AAFO68_05650 [Pseudomonadota bacterium]
MKKNIEAKLDAEKRETLKKLRAAAWVVPVVATFGLGAMNADAQVADSLVLSNVATSS